MGRITPSNFLKWGDAWGEFWGFQFTGLIEMMLTQQAIPDVIHIKEIFGNISLATLTDSSASVEYSLVSDTGVKFVVSLTPSAISSLKTTNDIQTMGKVTPSAKLSMSTIKHMGFNSFVVSSCVLSVESFDLVITSAQALSSVFYDAGLTEAMGWLDFAFPSIILDGRINDKIEPFAFVVIMLELLTSVHDVIYVDGVGTGSCVLSGLGADGVHVTGNKPNFLMYKCVPLFQVTESNGYFFSTSNEQPDVIWKVKDVSKDVMNVKQPKPRCEMKWV